MAFIMFWSSSLIDEIGNEATSNENAHKNQHAF